MKIKLPKDKMEFKKRGVVKLIDQKDGFLFATLEAGAEIELFN